MSNTIKHPFTGHEVRVRESLVGTGVVISDLANSQMIVVHPESAPALALAILEAAGWPECEPTSVTHTILSDLNRVVELQERITAEAKEQAELEAEALDMCNKYITELGYDPVDSWDGSVPQKKAAWLAVARKAREMRKP